MIYNPPTDPTFLWGKGDDEMGCDGLPAGR